MATDRGPSAASTRRGKGNRRTGRVKGTPGRRGQLPWRDDPFLLRRVELTGDLAYQPRSVQLATVNAWCKQEGQPPVSESTLKADLRRAAELAAERIASGAAARILDLERLKAAAWRDVNRLKEGDPARAPFYAAIFRATVAQAHLDGSWRAGAASPAQDQPAEIPGVGPSALELLEQGRISPEQYRAHHVVFHLATGGLSSDVRGPVIEGEARELPRPPGLPAPRVRALDGGGGGRPPLTVTAGGDLVEGEEEGPRVVEFDPDESFP